MTSQFISIIIFHLIYIFMLLYAGRMAIKIFPFLNKYYVPPAFIGGLMGLFLNQLVIKDSMFIQYLHDFPRFLIIGILATIPLGFMYHRKASSQLNASTFLYSLLFMALILSISGIVQNIVGLMIAFFMKDEDVYATFGTELSAGFSGGHGTAGVVGNILFELDQDYWTIAQDVTVTFATIGLIGGLFIGILLINIGARLRYTNYVQKFSILTMNMNVDTPIRTRLNKPLLHVFFHIILISSVSMLSIYMSEFIETNQIPVLTFIPSWGYGLITMFILWRFIQKTKLVQYIHIQVNKKITSILTDVTIVAAVSSISIDIIYAYIFPISVMAFFGFITTFLVIFVIARWVLNDLWFEKGVVLWGTSTGIFITGFMLLHIVDPKQKSNILEQYSIAYAMNNMISFTIIPFTFYVLVQFNLEVGLIAYIIILIFFASILLILKRYVSMKQ